ncbi:MAG: hypothetical protein ACTS73_07035 [Arsenophonus sp. NEOnobi-MAG3]
MNDYVLIKTNTEQMMEGIIQLIGAFNEGIM